MRMWSDRSPLPVSRHPHLPWTRLSTFSLPISSPVRMICSGYWQKDAIGTMSWSFSRYGIIQIYVIYGFLKAPRTFGDSRRWFREIRSLQPGEYEYVSDPFMSTLVSNLAPISVHFLQISFEVTNLSANNVVGVDQLTLLDSDQKPLC